MKKITIIAITLLLSSSAFLSGCGSNKKKFNTDKNGKLIGLEIPPEYDVRPPKDWKDDEEK